MMPTVTQTLSTMRLTLEQTVLPALPADGAFVQEQVGLMMATLDWLVDVHESEYRYELTENEEYRAFLQAVGRDLHVHVGGEILGRRPQNVPLSAQFPLVRLQLGDPSAQPREPRLRQSCQRPVNGQVNELTASSVTGYG